MDTGQKIKEARIRKGFSQSGLAARLGVSQPLVSMWEDKGHRVDPRYVPRINAVLKLNLQPRKPRELFMELLNGRSAASFKRYKEVADEQVFREGFLAAIECAAFAFADMEDLLPKEVWP